MIGFHWASVWSNAVQLWEVFSFFCNIFVDSFPCLINVRMLQKLFLFLGTPNICIVLGVPNNVPLSCKKLGFVPEKAYKYMQKICILWDQTIYGTKAYFWDTQLNFHFFLCWILIWKTIQVIPLGWLAWSGLVAGGKMLSLTVKT